MPHAAPTAPPTARPPMALRQAATPPTARRKLWWWVLRPLPQHLARPKPPPPASHTLSWQLVSMPSMLGAVRGMQTGGGGGAARADGCWKGVHAPANPNLHPSAPRSGVPRESAPGERRVPLTPAGAAALLKAGFQAVVVERGAGAAANFAVRGSCSAQGADGAVTCSEFCSRGVGCISPRRLPQRRRAASLLLHPSTHPPIHERLLPSPPDPAFPASLVNRTSSMPPLARPWAAARRPLARRWCSRFMRQVTSDPAAVGALNERRAAGRTPGAAVAQGRCCRAASERKRRSLSAPRSCPPPGHRSPAFHHVVPLNRCCRRCGRGAADAPGGRPRLLHLPFAALRAGAGAGGAAAHCRGCVPFKGVPGGRMRLCFCGPASWRSTSACCQLPCSAPCLGSHPRRLAAPAPRHGLHPPHHLSRPDL